MAALPESVNYTDKNFDALGARLIALIKSVFPDWTDFDVPGFRNCSSSSTPTSARS